MILNNKNENFENRLYVFVLRLLKFIATVPNNPITKVLIDQLIRSGTSILGNYIEAYASSSRKDYTNFFSYALKSANETKVWLALLRDTNNGNKEEIEYLLKEVTEIANILGSSILTLKGRK